MNTAHGAVVSVYHAGRAGAARRGRDAQKSRSWLSRVPEGARSAASMLARAALVLALVGGPSLALAHRERIVAAVPALGPAYAVIGMPVHNGLTVEDLHVRLSAVADHKVLMIEATIANPRTFAGPVPNLRIVLRGADGREIYAWLAHPPKDRLEASEKAHFATRLEAPPDGAAEAVVSFATGGTPSTR